MSTTTDTTATNPVTTNTVETDLSPTEQRSREDDRNRRERMINEDNMGGLNLLAFLFSLFFGMKDDEGLNSNEALTELADSLSIDRDIFSGTVSQYRSGEISLSEAATTTRSNMNVSSADISRAERAVATYAETGNPLLELIADKESGGDYNRIYGAGVQRRDLTNMTVNEVIAWQRQYTGVEGSASSAAGKYQIIRKTLTGLRDEMGLTGDELYDEEMQDRMAYVLLERRGYDDYLAGNMSDAEFMREVSKEWASMPKDEGGRSYYAGDGLNAAHATPETLMLAMRHAQDHQLTEHSTQLASTFQAAQANTEPPVTDPQQPEPLTDSFDGQGVDQTLVAGNVVIPTDPAVSSTPTLNS